MPGMRRREFITLLGVGAAAGWTLAARARELGKLPTVGFLGTTSEAAWSLWTRGFVERLRELGWVEGNTVAIEYRWTEGRDQRLAEIADEFVRLKVDIIVAGGAAVPALKQATSTIPIIFAIAPDPIGTGMVASLARPGGNVTGLSLQTPDLAGKRLELLREVVPVARRLAVLANAGFPAAALEMREVEAAGRTLGIEVWALEIRQPEDIVPAFEAGRDRADALYVCSDPLVNTNRNSIYVLALGARMPTISGVSEYVGAGGLMSYGPSYSDLFRRAGDFVDKILRGAKPGDIPVEQPTKFELAINLKTAKALGLEIPPILLARADEVIE